MFLWAHLLRVGSSQPGVDPNCIEEIHCGETISPLLIAACADTGTPDIVQELLSDERIEVDLQVGFACTPRTVLSHAVERNLEAIVERLLAGKARVYDKLPRKVSKNKRFPSTSHLDALDGAVVQGNPHIMEMVFQQAPDFDFKSSKGRYLTCTAAYFASLNGLRFLLDNGVEVDGADTTGKTPLFYTMKGLKSYNSDATCNDPDAAGDDYKKTYKWFLRMNDTPSEQTMFERARESAQLLIQNGARIDLGDKHGRTALSYAVHKPEYARLCLQLQASVNSKDFIGRTPLSHASQVRGNEPVVEMLLGHGADPTSKDIVGRTPLWFAVQAQSSGNVRLLISSCKDSSLIVSKDIFGKNPITMSLADVIGTDCVPSYFEELLCFNADSSEGPKILDQPMLLAAKYGQKKIYEKLLEKADSIGYHVPLQLDSFARGMLEQDRAWAIICSLCCRPILTDVSFQSCDKCNIRVCSTCRERGNDTIQPCDLPRKHHRLMEEMVGKGPVRLKIPRKSRKRLSKLYKSGHNSDHPSGREGTLDWVFESYEAMKTAHLMRNRDLEIRNLEVPVITL